MRFTWKRKVHGRAVSMVLRAHCHDDERLLTAIADLMESDTPMTITVHTAKDGQPDREVYAVYYDPTAGET